MNKHFELSQKLFYDDIEKAIQTETGIKLLLGTKKESIKAKELIGNYLKNKFSIEIDGKLLQLSYLGFEQENELIFAYFESNKINNTGKITITNTILMEVFSDQANVVHMNLNGKNTSLYFNQNNKSETIKL